MKRTRKWGYVEQEAKRLIGLGLSPLEISRRLGVNKATVNRWIRTGKLEKRLNASLGVRKEPLPEQSPAEWATSVRKDYDLDASDGQLVTLGERALEMAYDSSLAQGIRLNAMGRFQGIVKALGLVARRADLPEPESQPAARPVVRRADPRAFLMAVKA